MYRCLDCGCIFDIPKKVNKGVFYGVYESGVDNSYFELCPKCDGAIEEFDEEELELEESENEESENE